MGAMQEGAMATELLPDGLWARIAPLLPPKPRSGRPRVSDRAALTGILFVLKPGITWEYLPAEMGCGSGMTCWRRLRDWYQAGVWSWPRPIASTGTEPRKTPSRCRLRGAKKRAKSQWIGANGSRSAILWSTPTASRSRSWRAPQTCTIRR
jgi:hypothetical protein